MLSKKSCTAENREKLRKVVLLCSVLVISFAVYTSFAKYELASGGSVKIEIANWEMKLNGNKLTNNISNLDNSISFFIYHADDSEAVQGSPEPGESGYFDIQIDPTGTEVSFAYQVKLDCGKLPEKFSITSYSVNDGTRTNLNADVGGEILLGDKLQFTAADVQTIRYYWDWNASDTGENQNYSIGAQVEVQQILSKPEPE